MGFLLMFFDNLASAKVKISKDNMFGVHSLIFRMMYVSLIYTFIELIIAETFIFIGKLNAYFGRRLIHKFYLHVFKT
jgi:hypothetical protein